MSDWIRDLRELGENAAAIVSEFDPALAGYVHSLQTATSILAEKYKTMTPGERGIVLAQVFTALVHMQAFGSAANRRAMTGLAIDFFPELLPALHLAMLPVVDRIAHYGRVVAATTTATTTVATATAATTTTTATTTATTAATSTADDDNFFLTMSMARSMAVQDGNTESVKDIDNAIAERRSTFSFVKTPHRHNVDDDDGDGDSGEFDDIEEVEVTDAEITRWRAEEHAREMVDKYVAAAAKTPKK